MKYDNRPYNNELEMSWDLVSRWNEKVRENDIVYHLGDLFCGIHNRWDFVMDIVHSLNGKIILVPGNHDYKGNLNIFRREGIEVINDTYLIKNQVLMSHYPRRIVNTKNYSDSHRIRMIKDRLKKVYMKNQCKYHFYGHSHQYPAKKKNELNVSCTLHNYYPIRVCRLLD